MKKILTAVLTIALLVAVASPLMASAASGPAFVVSSNVQAERGGTVTVPIVVSNNPGFTAAGMMVVFDPLSLVLTQVTAPVAAMPLNAQFALSTVPGVQWINIVSSGLEDWSGSGTVINMTFNVRPDAAIGTSTISLMFTDVPDGTPANANGDRLGATAASGSVSISAGGLDTDTGDTGSAPGTEADDTGTAAPPPGGNQGGGGHGGGHNGSGADSANNADANVQHPQVAYSFLDGNRWVRGSFTDLLITIQREYALFDHVRVGGNVLSRYADFDAWSGSTNIALFFEYLETLPPGEHSLEVRFTDGVNHRTQFVTLAEWAPPEESYDEHSQIPDAGFIGEPYTQDGAAAAQASGSEVVASVVTFGTVPQTGIPSITGSVIVMALSALLSLSLLVYLAITIKRQATR